jgi:hypothetical protein
MNNLKRALQDELDSFFSVMGNSVGSGLDRVVGSGRTPIPANNLAG